MADEHKRPGWYPDPAGGGGERWWNGAGWSDSRRGAAAAAPGVPPTPAVIYSAANPAPQRPDPYGAYTPPTVTSPASGQRLIANASVNRHAMTGFVTGLVSVFFNIFFVLAPVAIVFSILGILKARALRAQGVTQNLMIFALIGLGCGILSAIIGIVQIAAFVVPIFSVSFD